MIIRSDNYITQPLVACGIIVYNQKDFIAQCIEGMLQQQCDFPFNIVVADDCSTDGTQDILRTYQQKYPDKIKLVLNEQNGGIAANWVSCCRAMEGGDYVSFCDGDDYWSNTKKLQLQVDYLRAHPKCVAVSTDVDNIDASGKIIAHNVRRENPPLVGNVQKDLWGASNATATWSSYMFTRFAFDKIPLQGFIDYDFPFQDWPAMVIMAAYGEFQFLPISTVAYRVAEGSDSHAIDYNKLLRRQERCRSMNKYLASLFPDVLPVDDDETFDRYIALTMISLCIQKGDYEKAKELACKSGHKNFRYWCCQHKWSFYLFRAAKLSKAHIHNLKRKIVNHIKY